jgi:hypothetical protein
MPVTRWPCANRNASRAVKRGIDACSTAASPESNRFSPQASSQKGIDALKIATTNSGYA